MNATARPASVVPFAESLGGALVVLISLALTRAFVLSGYVSALAVIAALTGYFFCVELLVRKAYRRPSSGLVHWNGAWRERLSWRRSVVKVLGLCAVLVLLAVVYRYAPWYQELKYQPYWDHLALLGPLLAVVAVPYIVVIDAMMAEPEDGYSLMGRFVMLRWSGIPWRQLLNFLLSWVVKGFFLPIMVYSMVQFMLTQPAIPPIDSILGAVYLMAFAAFMLDVSFAVVGYSMTLRVLDSHIRSVQPFWWGWVVCLMCYTPFSHSFGWFFGGYSDDRQWFHWLADWPLLMTIWGSAIIFFTGVFAWSTVMFGCRFSNLTNRGVITGGPYRVTKHPAYVSKNIGFWLASMPFFSLEGSSVAFMHCVALLSVNALYLLRALSEELHMSEDPDYVAYALWINEHGIFRWVGKVLPGVRYRPPKVPAAHQETPV